MLARADIPPISTNKSASRRSPPSPFLDSFRFADRFSEGFGLTNFHGPGYRPQHEALRLLAGFARWPCAWSTLVMFLPLPLLALYRIPLLLLVGIEKCADLIVRGLADLHHL